jgi:hypothetical protein
MDIQRQAIISEILRQLNDDVLYCAWLCQIVRLQNPTFTDQSCLGAVLDAVLALHQEGKIVVGDALELQGRVCIQPWSDENAELRIRLQSALSQSEDQDSAFAFWIQLRQHFS